MADLFGRVGSIESPVTRMIRATADRMPRLRSHRYGNFMCPVTFSSFATAPAPAKVSISLIATSSLSSSRCLKISI